MSSIATLHGQAQSRICKASPSAVSYCFAVRPVAGGTQDFGQAATLKPHGYQASYHAESFVQQLAFAQKPVGTVCLMVGDVEAPTDTRASK